MKEYTYYVNKFEKDDWMNEWTIPEKNEWMKG